MTSTTPTELVASLFEAFSKGDIEFILDHVTPDCRWILPSAESLPYGGAYNGPEGAAKFFETLGQTEQITRFEPREFIASGNAVVALGYEECTAAATGRKASTEWAMLFRFQDGKVSQYQSFFDTAAYAQAH